MLQICICDDDQSIANKLTPLIYMFLEDYQTQVTYVHSGESFLFHFKECPNFLDIVLMDIDMGELNGIETMIQFRKAGFTGQLIYLTSMRDYVFDSFDTFPMNYILKTKQSFEKLESVLKIAAEVAMKKRNCFLILGSNKNSTKLEKNNILYLESINRQIVFHMKDQSVNEFSLSLSQFFELNGIEEFVQIHKSYIVNLNNIRQIKPNYLILIDNTELPLGRKFVANVREKFSDFLSKNVVEV